MSKVEQFLAAGAFLQARREAERLLLGGELAPRDQGRAYRLACRACLSLQELFAAAKFGERAVERARGTHDQETLGKAHFDLGCAYTQIGDTHLAAEHLEAFLTLLPQLTGVERWEGLAYYNLSVVHRQRKQWSTAIQLLEQADWLFRKHAQLPEQAQVALDLAWCHLMLGDPAKAAPYLESVEVHLSHHPDDRLSADLICERALYFRLKGDLPAATELCRALFTPKRQGVGDHQLAEASWIMGENALDLGRRSEAAIFADLALNHAVKANWPSLMNLACDLRRRIKAAGAQ